MEFIHMSKKITDITFGYYKIDMEIANIMTGDKPFLKIDI